MATMKLGIKPEAFHREGQTWLCSSGLPSDVTIEVGDMSFHLHKFPLLSKSGFLEKLIEQLPNEDESGCVLKLRDIPGGAKAFELVAKFCYDVKIELTSLNIVSLRCAAEYLQMTEEHGEGNLISQTEVFLNEVFGNWTDTIKALETCEEVGSYAEEVHIVSRCIDSLAIKACADPQLFNWPVKGQENVRSPNGTVLWNGISSTTKPQPTGEDWWYEDVSFLRFPLYKLLILSVEAKGLKSESIAASLIHYTKKNIPLINNQLSFNDMNHVGSGITASTNSEVDQRFLLEELVGLLPSVKGVTTTNFLLRLLRTAMILHASPSCREILEKKIGSQLDQALLVDLLIPNMGYTVETLYDIDCIQRILDHFMSIYHVPIASSPCIVEEGKMVSGTDTLTPMTMVANLVDGYLAEVAPDVNLKLPKFQSLAAAIPDYARPLDDGIYHAIDVYLKAHPWLSDSEREQLCRLMNCQKLSLEASTHAAQNERLPLRVIVQVLFFEQLRLRTSISGWFFVSENLENSQHPNGNLELPKNDCSKAMEEGGGGKDVKERVSELERECLEMKMELEKVVKTKKSWSLIPKKLGFGRKSQPCIPKPDDIMEQTTSVSAPQNNEDGDLGQRVVA
ncbi:BTB/POZ domain-containing protein At5g03250 [Cucumis sativus]|uniref:Uncharacterized protein n=1 Tax=Cucumis sativus TaxID=3659 RepID=A0A0A0LFS3_CUCSA|nr:BTB/POZ domain-containing protein At5g03250 [Cucumis sativus]KGN58961.1 hypothetical protein Csa_002605 [Cucumis sativus]